jgi:hypothetical protein
MRTEEKGEEMAERKKENEGNCGTTEGIGGRKERRGENMHTFQ